MSSPICFNLDQSKILWSGNRLIFSNTTDHHLRVGYVEKMPMTWNELFVQKEKLCL